MLQTHIYAGPGFTMFYIQKFPRKHREETNPESCMLELFRQQGMSELQFIVAMLAQPHEDVFIRSRRPWVVSESTSCC